MEAAAIMKTNYIPFLAKPLQLLKLQYRIGFLNTVKVHLA
jgi:hypothetical protein